MASFVGLMLGFTSSPNVARAEESAAPVVVDKKAKLKAEIEKAQAAIKKNAKSKEERLKEQIAQLKEVEKTAETDFATKWGGTIILHRGISARQRIWRSRIVKKRVADFFTKRQKDSQTCAFGLGWYLQHWNCQRHY